MDLKKNLALLKENSDLEFIIDNNSEYEVINVNFLKENRSIQGIVMNYEENQTIENKYITHENERINLVKHICENFEKYTKLSFVDYSDNIPILIKIQDNKFYILKINNTYVDLDIFYVIKEIGLNSILTY